MTLAKALVSTKASSPGTVVITPRRRTEKVKVLRKSLKQSQKTVKKLHQIKRRKTVKIEKLANILNDLKKKESSVRRSSRSFECSDRSK